LPRRVVRKKKKKKKKKFCLQNWPNCERGKTSNLIPGAKIRGGFKGEKKNSRKDYKQKKQRSYRQEENRITENFTQRGGSHVLQMGGTHVVPQTLPGRKRGGFLKGGKWGGH